MPDKTVPEQQVTHFLDGFNYASLLQNAIRIAIIIAIAIVIWLVIRLMIDRAGARIVKHAEGRRDNAEAAKRRAGTLTSLMHKVIGAVYWIAIGLTLLSQLGIHIGAMVASAGILGLAVSFGARDLIANYIAGFYIILENQIAVGDVATIEGTSGTVEAINFRTTALRGGDGTLHVFTNSRITKLANLTRGWNGYLYEIAVSYEEDADRVIEVIKQVGAAMRADPDLGKNMTDDIEVWGVNKLADNAMVITGRLKTVVGAHWGTGRAFLARVKKAFDEAGINPNPHPRQIVLFDTKGPPLHISSLPDAQAKTEWVPSTRPGA